MDKLIAISTIVDTKFEITKYCLLANLALAYIL